MNQHSIVVEAKEAYKELIMAKPNVVGVGLGYKESMGEISDTLCVIAMVRRKVPRAGLAEDALIPAELNGVRTDVIQVGHLAALTERTDRFRPVPGGVSVGHYKVTAGTLGCVVRDSESGEKLILSNNHVLANSNDGKIGDPILQPGPVDGGRASRDMIATLERFVPIAFTNGPATCGWASGYAKAGNVLADVLGSKHRFTVFWSDPQATNRVDAAVGKPVEGVEVLDEILEIGALEGAAPAALGMPVRKSGRTSGFTTGQILVLEATVNIHYGDYTARFEGQIVTGSMSMPGDSGSLLVAGNSPHAVGLLFAGSDQATIYNPFEAVAESLGVRI